MRKRITFIFLFLVCLVIYANVINGGFILDDNNLIVNNQYIKHLRTIPLLFTSNLWRFTLNYPETVYNYYRPLQSISFALDYAIYKLNPAGFHITNILIHAINAFLIFYLLYRLFSQYQLALFSSLLFAVHPIHTEAVSFISGRSELLVSLFVLLGLIFYFDYLNSGKSSRYLISILCLIFSLLSRESGLSLLIPVFVLILGLNSRLPRKRAWLHFFTFSGIIALYGVLRLTVLVPIEQLPYKFLVFPFDLLNFLYILVKYIGLLIFPYPLYVLRTVEPITSYWSLPAFISLLFLFCLVTAVIISLKQKRYVLLFAISWFVIGLSYLILGMYKFTDRLSMEEHWVYLPSLGLFIILAYLLLKIPIKKIGMLIIAFVVLVSSALTVANNLHWKDEVDFYRYNLRFTKPEFSGILRADLAITLRKRGLYDQAIEEADTLLAINPNDWLAYIILGDTFKAARRYPQAGRAYKAALRIDPFCWQANVGLKKLAEETGQVYKQEVDPGLSPVEAEIISHLKMGEFYQAIEIINRELSISPSPGLYTLAGITFVKMGQYRQAINSFNAALELDPSDIRTLYNLSVVYERMRQFGKAEQIMKRANDLKRLKQESQ